MKTLPARGLLLLVMGLGACATSTPHPSPYFPKVAKHLDLGGEVFMYADVEGDLSSGAAYLDRLIERAQKTSPELKLDRIHVKRLLEQLGLDQILAVGLSSTQDGKIFHNKAFFHYGSPRRGLLLLTDAAPHELEIARQAPGDADIAFESDVRLKSFVDLIAAITKDVAGADAKDLLKGLDEKLPGTSLTLRQLFEHLDTRVVGILRVDPKRSFVVPSKDQNITIPGIDLLLSIDNLALLYDALAESLGKIPGVTAGLDGDLQFFEIDIPIPGAAWLKPVLAKDRKSGRVTFATHRAFIKEYLADKTATKKHLAAAPDFKKATDGFPSKANGLTYMSGAFLGKLADFARPFAKGDAKVQTGIDFIFDLLPEPGIPCATEQVNLPDGLFYASNATSSHKSTIFPGLVAAPLALAGAGAAVMVSSFKRSLAKHAAAAEVPRIEEESEEPAVGVPPWQPEKNEATPSPVSHEIYRIKVGKAPGRGGHDPKVTIIEFADFQCPFCMRAHATMDELAKVYGNDIRLVIKHNPLPFHDRAMAAALAAEAADEQGKFWAMHDKLFANQRKLSDEDLESYAHAIGLDMARFKSALHTRSKSLRKRIAEDQDEATRFGMTGTPNFLINGHALRGAYPAETFKAAIDDEIKKADEKLRKGVARKNLYAELTKGGLDRALPPKPVPNVDRGEPDPTQTYRADITGAPVRGAKDALVTIVQFSDYQCPFCQRVEPTLTKILDEYKGKVRVAWRDLPLAFHPRAKDAAIAARAAGKQGKYWQMHDKLFAGQTQPEGLGTASIERYADEIGLNVEVFKAALQRVDLAEAVDDDARLAQKLGVRGAPGFFINGKFLSGAQPFEKFQSKIEEELRNAEKLVAKGTPKDKVYNLIMKGANPGVGKPAP